MKQRIHTLFMGLILLVSTLSCIKEDMEECRIEPKPAIDENFLILAFECINQNYLFPDIVEDLELLFYNSDNILVYDFRFGREKLREMDWDVVFFEEDGPVPDTYQIIALVNYSYEEHIQVTGKENRDEFLATIDRDLQDQVGYKLKDTYHGTLNLEVKYTNIPFLKHIVYLSKNTNTVKLTVEFDDQDTPQRLVSYRSYISGNNGEYR